MNGTQQPSRAALGGAIALTAVSILWAFSFGLIKTNLAGIPAPVLAFLRLGLAALCFLPLLRLRALPPGLRLRLTVIGAVQYGCMYMLLFQAFRTLQAYEVVLFTLFTPLFVELLGDWGRRAFRPLRWLAVVLAVVGAAVIRYRGVDSEGWWTGFLLMQGANGCFAWGQVAYRRLKQEEPALDDARAYALVFLGAAVVAGVGAAIAAATSGMASPTPSQWAVILYLGAVASGLGFFFWNWGAARVRSVALLAVMNNLSIPLGVLVSLAVFGESANPVRLIVGGGLIGISIWLATRVKNQPDRTA